MNWIHCGISLRSKLHLSFNNTPPPPQRPFKNSALSKSIHKTNVALGLLELFLDRIWSIVWSCSIQWRASIYIKLFYYVIRYAQFEDL